MSHKIAKQNSRSLAGIGMAIAGMVLAIVALFGADPQPGFESTVSLLGGLSAPFLVLVGIAVLLIGGSLRLLPTR